MKKVDQMIASALGKPEVLRAARAQVVMHRWDEVVGPALAAKTSADRFERGTLWVVSEGSAWAQEIRLRREEIIARLNEIGAEPRLFSEIRVGSRAKRKK